MAKNDCTRKIAHDTFYDAMVSMMRTRYEHTEENKLDHDCGVYLCNDCGSYHWGHKPKGEMADPDQIKACLDHCRNVRQVDWVMRFYTRTIVKMQKSRSQHLRTMAIHIINLADYQRRFGLDGKS